MPTVLRLVNQSEKATGQEIVHRHILWYHRSIVRMFDVLTSGDGYMNHRRGCQAHMMLVSS